MVDFFSSTYIIPLIAIGYLIYSIVRIVLSRKLSKQRKDYEAMIQKKMDDMQSDISARSKDLQESIQMINHEYTQLMSELSVGQKKAAEELGDKIKKLQEEEKNKDQTSSSNNDVK